MERGARFSPCRRWRYTLWRTWDRGRTVNFIGLNPSTATEELDDPTIWRCIRFARDWGFAGVVVTNVFAYRATDARVLRSVADPVGSENDAFLVEEARRSDRVVAAWGASGGFRGRHREALDLLKGLPLDCLGVTKEGFPKHPLHLAASVTPVPFPYPSRLHTSRRPVS